MPASCLRPPPDLDGLSPPDAGPVGTLGSSGRELEDILGPDLSGFPVEEDIEWRLWLCACCPCCPWPYGGGPGGGGGGGGALGKEAPI